VEYLRASLPPLRPTDAIVDIDLDSIPGTYSDAAYGQMSICALHDKSAACSKTLAGNPFAIQNEVPSFVAYFPKFWLDYLLFTHRNGSTFAVTPSGTYAAMNVTVVAPFETYDAVFDGNGMAWTRGAWGIAPGVQDRSLANGLKEGGEVWFEKQCG
jgi:hypothetical protein